MTSFEDGLPPTYDEVLHGTGAGPIPSAPPIAVPPQAAILHAPLGFDAVHHPQAPATVHPKEQEASDYGATNKSNVGPGFDPEDDRPTAAPNLSPPGGPQPEPKREFVIRFTCPSCDCSNLVPRCGSLTCCSPDIGCFQRLMFLDTNKETEYFDNLTWSKTTDRHFIYFFRKPEDAGNNPTAQFINGVLFLIFLLCTAAMFLVTPWAAIFIAVFYECEDSTLRPLLASYGAVALAESFQRVCCYLLSKLDRPRRAIKEIESPNALWVPLLVIFIAIATRIPDLTDCSVNNSISSSISMNQTNTSDVRCCDDILIKASLAIPIAWVVYEILIVAGVSLKLILDF